MHPKQSHSRMLLHNFSTSIMMHSIAYLVCIMYSTHALSGIDTDRLALLEVKASISQDPLRVFDSWNDTLHICNWKGVKCGHRHQRVTSLKLRSLHLSGTISPSIGNMSFLTVLSFENNSLVGQIPPQLGNLHRLQVLILSNNSLTGEIPPNISNCSNMVVLILVNNKLEGPIPMELGHLTKLEILALEMNYLNGTIPSSLGNISSLLELFLDQNSLFGNLPDSLGKLMNLDQISLSQNDFSGTIPSSIFNLSSLTGLDFGINNLHGTLPPNLCTLLPNLQVLYFNANNFSGSIPTSISNASSLQSLGLVANSFSGEVPSLEKLVHLWALTLSSNHLGSGQDFDLNFISSLTNATSLQVLDIGDNNFGGNIPKEIGNLSSHLIMLILGDNQLIGGIPIGIRNLINLEGFNAGKNKLSGSIPSSICKLQNLKELVLEKNNFSGQIPSCIGNLTVLLTLLLGTNRLEGNIPSSVMNCQNLLHLDLSSNNLSGAIPLEIMSLSFLAIALNLSHNHLVGGLPKEIGTLKNLGVVDVSRNMLSGEIPSTLGSCVSVEELYLSGNQFQGSIPSSLVSLKALLVLDVSSNFLSGKVPDFLQDLRLLENLNLSGNDFEGPVPTGGIFRNSTAVSLVGNAKLCGGIPDLKLPSCHFDKQKAKISQRMKIVLSAIFVPLSLAIVIICLSIFRKRRKKREDTSGFNEKLPQLSYQALLRATSGFAPANLIGSGSFGYVYKGILEPQGMVVAVKVLNLNTNRGASKSFIAECEALRNIRHRNLVKIVTACSSVDYQGNEFKALVYEFMANGSFDDWLHPSQERPQFLNLVQRLNICIDVACALEYLHYQCGATRVHCDLKPSNVLLDDEMVGHLSDFGLSKVLVEAPQQHTSQVYSSVVRGTIGYTPPEYAMGGEVSINGDIYSYGILLLETFSAKRPTDAMFRDGLTLTNFVESSIPEKVAEVMDNSMFQVGSKEMEAEKHYCHCSNEILECLISVFKIGVGCSAESPRERIGIDEAISQLYSIRSKLLKVQVKGSKM